MPSARRLHSYCKRAFCRVRSHRIRPRRFGFRCCPPIGEDRRSAALRPTRHRPITSDSRDVPAAAFAASGASGAGIAAVIARHSTCVGIPSHVASKPSSRADFFERRVEAEIGRSPACANVPAPVSPAMRSSKPLGHRSPCTPAKDISRSERFNYSISVRMTFGRAGHPQEPTGLADFVIRGRRAAHGTAIVFRVV